MTVQLRSKGAKGQKLCHLKGFVFGYNIPRDASEFVGKSDGRSTGNTQFNQRFQPSTHGIIAFVDPTKFCRSFDALKSFESVFHDISLRDSQSRDLVAWLARYVTRNSLSKESQETRREHRHAVNPLYLPRNWLAQQAIDATEWHTFMQVLRKPYQVQAGHERFALPRPEWARNRAGCSMLPCGS